MIRLFPRARRILTYGLIGTAVVTGMMIIAGEDAFAIFTVVTGAWLSWVACLYSALNAHRRVLDILYEALDPSAFLEAYRPLLERVRKGSAMEAAMRAHIGNAYSAMGEYEAALSWYTADCDATDVRLMQAENRSRCFLALDDEAALAEEEKRWDAYLPEVKPKRREASERMRALLAIRRRVAQGRAETADQVRVQEEQRGTNKRLHRAEMSLLLARIYRLLHYDVAAREELTRLAALNPQLACARDAKDLLNELAAETERSGRGRA